MIGITGASGKLGSRVLASVRDCLGADNVIGLARIPSNLPGSGRWADFDQPDSLEVAFAGVETLLFVASNAPDPARMVQHAAVVAAATAARVGRVVYTSLVDCDRRATPVDKMHSATEDLIRRSGMSWTFLRNGEYTENWINFVSVSEYATTGLVRANVGGARLVSATRDDLAEATATVMLGKGHAGKTYDLTGDRLWGFAELAAAVERATSRPVMYRNVSNDEQRRLFQRRGLPAHVVDLMMDVHREIRVGGFARPATDLTQLLGREPQSMEDAVAAAVGHGESP
ncbi:NAD(P)H-binding protein [Agreia sp. PsM10]|uniref:NAD(P)H-binding protein n=1 Tax=Agreia sp. PsM10 TaxID=3030533 RepID=UPI00263BA09B|nr:NAD(P)H-binding protein [Agreia sp. PsM10]MDN4640414.1 NAD(P)H-binding protein [Agreia sp. PsM10]